VEDFGVYVVVVECWGEDFVGECGLDGVGEVSVGYGLECFDEFYEIGELGLVVVVGVVDFFDEFFDWWFDVVVCVFEKGECFDEVVNDVGDVVFYCVCDGCS